MFNLLIVVFVSEYTSFTFGASYIILCKIITFVSVSDLLMGIYLLLIGIHDSKYRNIYNLEAQNWMSSWGCTITGIIAMVSCEVSVLLLVFMSVDRFLIIAMPYGKYSALNMKETIIALLFIWCLGIILAVFPGRINTMQ